MKRKRYSRNCFLLFSLYGFSGNNSDQNLHKENMSFLIHVKMLMKIDLRNYKRSSQYSFTSKWILYNVINCIFHIYFFLCLSFAPHISSFKCFPITRNYILLIFLHYSFIQISIQERNYLISERCCTAKECFKYDKNVHR